MKINNPSTCNELSAAIAYHTFQSPKFWGTLSDDNDEVVQMYECMKSQIHTTQHVIL